MNDLVLNLLTNSGPVALMLMWMIIEQQRRERRYLEVIGRTRSLICPLKAAEAAESPTPSDPPPTADPPHRKRTLKAALASLFTLLCLLCFLWPIPPALSAELTAKPNYAPHTPIVLSVDADGYQLTIKPQPGGTYSPDAKTLCVWAGPGSYTLFARGADGRGLFAEFTVGGDSPLPPPDPPAPPGPTPQKISAAIVEESSARAAITPAQVAALVSADPAKWSKAAGSKYFVLDRDALAKDNQPNDTVRFFLKHAGEKLPALVIGTSGSKQVLYNGPLPPDSASLLKLLETYGGKAPALTAAAPQIDHSLSKLDEAQPADRAAGLLPRSQAVTRFGGLRTFSTDFKEIPRADWPSRLLSLQPRVWHVFNQGRLSSCASNATAQSLMLLREIAGMPRVVLSPGSLYGQVTRTDSGSTLDDNLSALAAVGLVPSSAMDANAWTARSYPADWKDLAKPYRVTEWYDLGGKVESIATAVLYGFPVVIGVDWPGGGGHAVLVVGLVVDKGTVRFLICNSWGPEWNNGGFGTLSEPVVRTSSKYGAFAPRVPIYDLAL